MGVHVADPAHRGFQGRLLLVGLGGLAAACSAPYSISRARRSCLLLSAHLPTLYWTFQGPPWIEPNSSLWREHSGCTAEMAT